MANEKNRSINLLPGSVKKFFLDSVDKKAHTTAKQYIHKIENVSEKILNHHLDFEMERLETDCQSPESAQQEEYRLAIVYSNSPEFKTLKDEFKKTEEKLLSMNPSTAQQVVLHIEDNTDLILSEMVLKKQLEKENKKPFRSSIGTTKHIH